MKKVLKITAIVISSLLIFLFAGFIYLDEGKPEASYTPEADSLANKMLIALNKPAWDTTAYIQWTFRGSHDYLWDKERNFVQLEWKGKRVLLNTKNLDQSIAFVDGNTADSSDSKELIQEAWKAFCNDSYWLVAPFKVFDPGTKRALIDSNKLLVEYTSGGVTPGDSYLWILDNNYVPKSYKMWVSIIPVGGLKATWEGWHETNTGVLLPKRHKILFFGFSIENIRTASSFDQIGFDRDPFEKLNSK